MRLKKKAVLLISAILVFCLTACGADRDGNQSNADNTSGVSYEPSAENVQRHPRKRNWEKEVRKCQKIWQAREPTQQALIY